ncbi:GFA family protein [Motilimonas sp. 1_MG-2023]|uniref:GFA family protein n=1 Tax=Motilimonas sp. 1_MG-2023 TaxID=3062672 RepID=UPI0026E14B89|nr:GFA family protein [Motilimonas sp. 1_MG-2023]MDO6524343.1 GFA family protein [Motilimonas sp. 1_MG-2023]
MATVTYAVSLAKDFKLLRGQLKAITLTDKATKFVCSQCCSPIYNKNQRFNGLNMLYLGALDQAEALPAEVNLYTSTKLTWLDGLNEMPSLEGRT